MHGLWRLNRTETVAVQTNYVLARHELQESIAVACDATLNGLPPGDTTLRATQFGVQEGERALPRQRRGGAIVGIRAIWLEEPVCGSWISIEGGLFARRLKLPLQLRN